MNPSPAPPTDQRRVVLAIALSGAVVVLWSLLFPPAPPPERPVPAPGSAEAPAAGTPRPDAPPRPADPLADVPDEVATVLGVPGHHAVALGVRDGQVRAWDLEESQYRQVEELGKPSSALRFVGALTPDQRKGLFLPPLIEVELDGQRAIGAYQVVEQDARRALLAWTDPARGVRIEREYRLNPDNYTLDVAVRLRNEGAAPVRFGLATRLRGAQNDEQAAGSWFSPPVYLFEGLCQRQDGLEREPIRDIAEMRAGGKELPRYTDGIRWGGIDNRYFMTAVYAADGGIESCELFAGPDAGAVDRSSMPPATSIAVAVLTLPGGEVGPGQVVERRFGLYGGPKKHDALSAVSPSLSAAVDFGWFGAICIPMLKVLRWFYGLIPNWGIAIILLTILVKLLTLPLTHKQYKSMAAMRQLQPKLKALQEKFKEDRLRLQQEMMKLYKEHNINPLAGCLPVLMMMPVYIALYRTIYSAVELYQADLGLWIHDLSERDPYLILPIALGGLMIIQTRLSPAAGDALQQKMLTWVMPIMFTMMMLFLPAGLVVYIFANTLLGILQQWWMLKKTAGAAPVPARASGR